MTVEFWYIVMYEIYAIIFLGIRTYEFWISRRRKMSSTDKSLPDRFLVLCVLLLFYFSMFYYPFNPDGTLLGKLTYEPIRWFGFVLTLLSLLLLLVSARVLGSNWSAFVEPYDDHQLITNGIYRFIRHPIYTAISCFVFGMSLITGDPLIWIVLILPHFVLFSVRIPREEILLIETFGGEYLDYMKITRRLIPFVY